MHVLKVLFLIIGFNCFAVDQDIQINNIDVESRICYYCHCSLDNDILDFPCENVPFMHIQCYIQYAMYMLKEGEFARCLQCQRIANLSSLNLNFDSIKDVGEAEAAKRNYITFAIRNFILACLEKLLKYPDLSFEGRSIAEQLYKKINSFSAKQCLQIINSDVVSKWHIHEPNLEEALLVFADLKDNRNKLKTMDEWVTQRRQRSFAFQYYFIRILYAYVFFYLVENYYFNKVDPFFHFTIIGFIASALIGNGCFR